MNWTFIYIALKESLSILESLDSVSHDRCELERLKYLVEQGLGAAEINILGEERTIH